MTHTLTVHEGGLAAVTQHSRTAGGALMCVLGIIDLGCTKLEKAVVRFGGLVHNPELDGDILPAIDSRPAPGVYRVDVAPDGNLEPGGRIS